MHCEQTYGLVFAQNIGILENNMMFAAGTLEVTVVFK